MGRRGTYTRDEILDALKRASVDGVGPTTIQWDAWLWEQGLTRTLPCAGTVAKLIGGGSWLRALRVAGVEGHSAWTNRWTKHAIARALRRDFERLGRWPTTMDWVTAAKPRGSRPSCRTVYEYFPTWGAAIALAKAVSV